MTQRIRLQREPLLYARLQAFTYQQQALDAVQDLEYAALFHEQGLGKTKIAIDVALHWLKSKQVDTVVIVVKKGLLANWKRELAAHAHLKPRILSQSRNSNYYVFNSPARLVLTHYEVVKTEHDRMALFLKTRDIGVILDESTKIKNPDSALTKAFHSLSPLFYRRLIMTGTPIPNRPYDIWSQIWFLDQGESLGCDFKEFKSALDLSDNLATDSSARDEFERRLADILNQIGPFTVRETKESAGISLPNKEIYNVLASWEKYQLDLYEQIRDEMRAVVVKEGIPSIDRSENLLKRLLRLVQVASNPRLLDESYSKIPGKYSELEMILEDIVHKGEKAIVWSSFVDNVRWLSKEFNHLGSTQVHGRMKIQDRQRSIDRFLDDDRIRILFATPPSAGEGLTLTVANNIIFYDRSFSLDDYLQAQDRIHRISQERDCRVTNLIMPDSIDEWIDVLLYEKKIAAQYAQGDMSEAEFKSSITYQFPEVLRQVLGLYGE